jgi:cysteine desulfurase
VDMLTINGGKIYGPKGVGVLYVKKGIQIAPQSLGGAQEYNLRAGTENVPAIVGMGEALLIAARNRSKESTRLIKLRDYLIKNILKKIPDSSLNGHHVKRLPNNINFCFYGIEGESILLRLDQLGICGSSGSACTSNSLEPSHVLLAIQIPKEEAHGSLRLTLGKKTTKQEIDFVLKELPKIIKDLRKISPLY